MIIYQKRFVRLSFSFKELHIKVETEWSSVILVGERKEGELYHLSRK
jgi:hypothetical protein